MGMSAEGTHTVETAGDRNIHHPAANRIFVDEVDTPTARAPLDEMPAGSFESSNVHSAIYDFGERRLYLRFLREGPDAIYQYWDVPAQVWSGLVEASSKGRYVNQYIATDYRYAKAGRDDFPTQQSMRNDLLRRFVYGA